MPWRIKVKDLLLFLFLDSFAGFFVFRNQWFIVGLLPLFFWYQKILVQRRKEEERKKIRKEFLMFLQSLESYMFLGYAVEQAFIEAEKDLKNGSKHPGKFSLAISDINKKRMVGEGIEGLFLEYASKTDIDEILLFAQVLCFLQKKGGDIQGLIHGTSDKIRWMMDMDNQMEVVSAAKKMEARIMMIAPFGILLFMNYSNKEYMSWYYNNPIGYFALAGLMCFYLFAVWLTNRILLTNTER